MKAPFFKFLVVMMLLVILFAVTTPTQYDHHFYLEREFSRLVTETAAKNAPEENEHDSLLTILSKGLSSIDVALREEKAAREVKDLIAGFEYRNYVVFSLTRYNGKAVSWGILGQIMLCEDVNKTVEGLFNR